LYQRNAGGDILREDIHTYTSYSGAVFSGVSPALAVTYDSNDTALVPYIEKVVTTATESVNLNYVSDRQIVTIWRLKGFKQFIIAGTFGSTGYSTGVVKNKDSSVNLP